jgi:capsular exopolysaccharide synthesis family protein
LGAPSLGLIPIISEGEPHLLPEMKGLASAAESYRILRTNIHFSAVDNPVQTLLITSSGPSEGKTTTATNIAFAMALDGKKVILVDTDLRRPSLHKTLKLPVAPGLTDLLLGHSTLADTLQPHEGFPNLSILCSGSTPPNPGELLNSRKFRSLVQELKESCDIVIFDSAPVLVAADSAILASQVDGTLFVVEAGSTKKTTSKRAMQILNQARASILGIAYNKMSSHEGEGYYRYNYHTLLPEGQSQSRNGHSNKLISSMSETNQNVQSAIEFGEDDK